MQKKFLAIFILLSLFSFFYTTNQQTAGWCKPIGSWTVPTCDQCNRQTTVSGNLCPNSIFETTTVYGSMYCQSLNYQCALNADGTINPAGKYVPINQWCKPLSGWTVPSCSTDCHLVNDRSQCPSGFDTSAVYGGIGCGGTSGCTFVAPTAIISSSTRGWCKPIGSWTVPTCSQCQQELITMASLCPVGFETTGVYGSMYCGSQSYKCSLKSDGYTVNPAGSYADQPLWCKPIGSWLIPDCSKCYKVSYANQCPTGYDQTAVYAGINCNNWSTTCKSTIQNIVQGWCKPIGSWTVLTCDQCKRQYINTAILCDSNKFETTTVYHDMYCNNLNYKCGQNADGSVNVAGVYSPTNQWCKQTSTWIVSSCSNCKFVSDQSQCPTGFDTNAIYGSMQCYNGATIQLCAVPALPSPITCTSCSKGWCKPIGSWTVPTCSQCQQELVSQANLCPAGFETTSVWGSMYCSTESYKCATFADGTVNPAGQYQEIKHWCKPLTSWVVPTCAQCQKVSYAYQCPTGFDQTQTYGLVYCVNTSTFCQ